ncbi:MAG: urease accessory protein UreD [Verrucomicrobia bacterium]|nr:urease accessory protein UreD [Verrucomicrobiota bacterium]MDA1046012.1 urease accessory protein UreD [Verrucomicrobiota bacterium]
MKPPADLPPSALGLSGGVELRCAADSEGRPILERQYFRPPIHIGKPYHDQDADVLLVNLACPTAGLLENDRVRCDVTVGPGGRLLLTTPGATRAHAMRGGKAIVEQRLVVESGGFLEYAPEILILQRDSHLVQSTAIEVASGGELIFTESIAPGRVAHGESFAFSEFSNKLRIHINGYPVARESFRLRPDDGSLLPWTKAFPTPWYAAFYCLSEKIVTDLPGRDDLHSLSDEQTRIGATRLQRGGWVIKILAADSIALRKVMAATRTSLYAALQRSEPSFRRY